MMTKSRKKMIVEAKNVPRDKNEKINFRRVEILTSRERRGWKRNELCDFSLPRCLPFCHMISSRDSRLSNACQSFSLDTLFDRWKLSRINQGTASSLRSENQWAMAIVFKNKSLIDGNQLKKIFPFVSLMLFCRHLAFSRDFFSALENVASG